MKNDNLKQIIILSVLFLGVFFLFSFLQKEESDSISEINNPNSKHYFQDKTIEWIIPFKEGGGGDTWARFNAPFFQKHIPGNPAIVVNNIPGGGSIKGANLFAERVKPNGLMILGTSGTTQMPYLLDDPRVRYDYSKYKPIMAYPTGGVAYVSPDIISEELRNLKVNSVEEQIEKSVRIIQELIDNKVQLKYGSQGPTSLDIVTMFSFDLLKLDVQAVFGFRGRGAGRLAFERGEVKIDYQTSSAYLKNSIPLVESGDAIPLFSFGALDDNGQLIRDESFANSPVGVFNGEIVRVNVPHFGEVYERLGHQLSGIEWDTWFAFMSAGFGGMKLLLTPKETPDEIVAEFHKGIGAMKEDPEYQKNKFKALGEYKQVIGKPADKIFDLATNVGTEEKAFMKSWLIEKYDLNLK
ncbi:MAG: hypothetical protein P1U70_25690 [Saprospiraceae bacterium]|jgi:hypothetical protein|nr:hypothetical protein [Saprospiraceae bacterium]